MCQMSHAMCQIGHVTCPLLHVTFHCQVSNVKKKKSGGANLLSTGTTLPSL